MRLKTAFLIMGLAMCAAVFGQQSVSSSANIISASSGTVSYTVGQPIVITMDNNICKLNHGVHQGYFEKKVTGISFLKADFTIKVYPNPVVSNAILNIDYDDLANFRFVLTDIKGSVLMSDNIVDNSTPISMSGYTSGVYFIKIMQHNKQVASIKIIKA